MYLIIEMLVLSVTLFLHDQLNLLTLIWVGFSGVRFEVRGGRAGVKLLPVYFLPLSPGLTQLYYLQV